MDILVTGGTGTLGQHVAAGLVSAGHAVRVLSRREHADSAGVTYRTGNLRTGDGLAEAVAGAAVVMHCASERTGDAASTGNLIRAALASGTSPHLVYISVTSTDAVRFRYLTAKRECEQLVAQSGLPWTILRATQFFEMLRGGAGTLIRLPVVPVPAGFVLQPVAAVDVAARLCALAAGDPAGRAADIAGPQVLSFAEIIRATLTATGRRRPVLSLPVPGIGAIRQAACCPRQMPARAPSPGRNSWPRRRARRFLSP